MKKLFILSTVLFSFISVANAQDGFEMFKVSLNALEPSTSRSDYSRAKTVSTPQTSAYKNVAEVKATETDGGYKVTGVLKQDGKLVCQLPENLIVNQSRKAFECGEHEAASSIVYAEIGDDTIKKLAFFVSLPNSDKPAAFYVEVDRWHRIVGCK